MRPMGLGERCDEIVRLIDETLAAFGADLVDTSAEPCRRTVRRAR